MKKGLIVILFFSFFFFPNPVHAQNEGFLASLLNFFKGIAGYSAKNPEPVINNSNLVKRTNFTTYSKIKTNPNDITTRALSDKPRLYSKGQHIEDIILNTYSSPSNPAIDEEDDKILAYDCNHTCVDISQSTSSCRPIRTSEVAYFFLTKNDSTSYDLGDNETLTKKPYSSEIKQRLNNKYQNIQLVADDCYYDLYDQITVTPKSNDNDRAEKNTGISDQLNATERTFLPKSIGDSTPPSLGFWDWLANIFNGGNTRKLKDNLYKEKVFLTNVIPEKQVETIDFDDSNKNVRKSFSKIMQPASWQDDELVDTEDPNVTYNPEYPGGDITPVTLPSGLQLYIFEPTTGGGRLTHVYDIGVVDPSKLTDVPDEYKAKGASNTKLDSRVIPAYIAMVQAARAAGYAPDELNLASGYRSIAQQQVLWDNSDKTGKYVARPGGSPHHTGRALDLIVGGLGPSKKNTDKQKNSATYLWLQTNAATFGFYNYPVEPWHWEYNPKAP